jgi:SAM-dependent methyltransferase
MSPSSLNSIVSDPNASVEVERVWDELTQEFDKVNARKLHHYMKRREVSFHTHVKLLGYLALALKDVKGDILEIGVWKGKSLALMHRLAGPGVKAIGLDPLEVEGQAKEILVFQKKIFPDITIVTGYSEYAASEALALSHTFKLLHIDGGHLAKNVWIDYLAYGQFVVPGGYLVFDDYDDHEFSPEVGPAVDRMRELGLFEGFELIGQIEPFTNSYVLRRKA